MYYTTYSIYSHLLFASLALALLLFVLVHKVRPKNRISLGILWLTLIAIGVESSVLLAMRSPNAAWAAWWHGNVRLAIYAFIPPVGFFFVHAFVSQNNRVNKRALWVFFIPLVISTAALTNDWHHWFFGAYSMHLDEVYVRTVWQPGSLYWVHTVYAYFIGLAILWLLILWLRRPERLPRLRGLLMLSVAVLLIGAISLDTFGMTPAPGVLILPVSLGIITILLILGVWNLDLLDILPVARETLIRYMSDAVFVVDAQSRVLDVNPEGEKVVGRPAAEILGRDILEFVVHEERVKRAREILSGEFRGVLPLSMNGVDHFFDAIVTDICLENKVMAAKLIVLRDITEHKQTEVAYHESDKRYRFLSENISDVIWILDLETQKFRYVSPSVERLRGYTAEEVLTQDMAASLTPDSFRKLQAGVPAELEKFLRGEQVEKYYVDQLEQPCKDGSTVWTETTTRFVQNPESGHVEVYGVSRDITERKRAEDALRLSEERYRWLAENMIDMLWILDWETQKFRYVSPSVKRLRGFTVEEAMAQDISEVLTPASLKTLQDKLPGVYAEFLQGQQKHYTDQFEQPCKDGSIIWTETTTQFVRNPDNNHVEIYGITRNITERKRAEDALRLSEERYRLLADKAPLAVAVVDLWTSNIVYANQRACDLFEMPVEKALGTKAGDRYVDRQDREELIRLLRESNSVVNFEARLLKGSGREFWASITSNLTIFEGRPAIHSVYIDITARKQAEEALRESELTARTLLGLPDAAIMLLGLDATILDCNETLAQRLGVDVSDLVGKNTWSLLSKEVAEIRQRHFVEAVDSGRTMRWEDTRNGRWFDNMFIPIADPEGKVTKIIGCGYDITARKLAEVEQSQQATLEERQRLARDLHDAVSQTLFSARLTSEMLLRQKDTIQPGLLWENIDHFANLVRSALGEMRILLLELRPEGLENAALPTLLSHLVDAAKARTGAEIRYDTQGQGELPLNVKIAFYRIAQEALNNALKHSQCEEITIKLTYEAGGAVLTVSDDGRGFDLSENQGTQMGLNIMRERAAETGARLDITGLPAGGTCVTCVWRSEGSQNGS